MDKGSWSMANTYQLIHSPLIIKRGNQQQQQSRVQHQAMKKGNEWAIISWKVEFQDEVRKQHEYHPKQLNIEGKHHILALVKQGIDQEDSEGIIQDKTDASVEDEPPYIFFHPDEHRYVHPLE